MTKENVSTLYHIISSHRFSSDIKLSKGDVIHGEFYNGFIDKFLKYLMFHDGGSINEYIRVELNYLYDYFLENKIKNDILRYCFEKLIGLLSLYKNW